MAVPGIQIHIISKKHLQSQLLARFLQMEIGIPCTVHSSLNESFRPDDDEKNLSVVLWDCEAYDQDNLWSELMLQVLCRAWNCYVVLFNATKDAGIELDAMSRGIRGVFFQNTETQLFARGVRAIIKGEWWFSRECMAQYLATSSGVRSKDSSETNPLTAREKEILLKFASGSSMAQISADFSISPHTVKTHIRNIYKKLGVKNRFEAIRLASKYI